MRCPSWQLDPKYEIAAERQSAILDETLGVDFATELTRFAAKARSYRRPR